MKLDKDEIIVKNVKGEEFVLNTTTKKCRPLPIEKQQIRKEWDSKTFADSIIKLAKEEFAAGKHKTLIDAYDSIINQYPEGYEQYSKENMQNRRSD